MNDSYAEHMRSRYLWTRYVMFASGIWLAVTPATFAQHSILMTTSDVVCGILIMIFSMLALNFRRHWAPWTLCAIGVWLQFAPLLFWAPNAVGYLNDTTTGALLLLLSIIVPGTPGGVELKGGEIPPGWTYNPSSWNQRLPVILLAFLAWMSARYMAAYQLGYIHTIWDPIFGDGTQKVITSKLSQNFPVSDAGLGALVYSLEVLLGFKGSTRRWYTMPWIVLIFGIMVVPAGFVSILLIISQPLIVGYWCGWCLFTAICMLVMIALTLDEMLAVFQYLYGVIRNKQPFWHIFWKGGTYEEGALDQRSPPLNAHFAKNVDSMFWGVSFPWNLLVSLVLGGVLMFAPNYMSVNPILSPSDFVAGALVCTFSFIATAEVLRSIRFLNILLALWVLIFTLLHFKVENSHYIFHMVWSVAVIALSIPRGKIKESYGNWKGFIR